MRIRKNIDKGPGFINTARIEWQPVIKRFLLSISLSPEEVGSFGLTVGREKFNSLPSVLFIDETIIKTKINKVHECIEGAHEKHEHRGYNKI